MFKKIKNVSRIFLLIILLIIACFIVACKTQNTDMIIPNNQSQNYNLNTNQPLINNNALGQQPTNIGQQPVIFNQGSHHIQNLAHNTMPNNIYNNNTSNINNELGNINLCNNTNTSTNMANNTCNNTCNNNCGCNNVGNLNINNQQLSLPFDNIALYYPNIRSLESLFAISCRGAFSMAKWQKSTRIDIINISKRVLEHISFVFAFVDNYNNFNTYTTKTIPRLSPGQTVGFYVPYAYSDRVHLIDVVGLDKVATRVVT